MLLHTHTKRQTGILIQLIYLSIHALFINATGSSRKSCSTPIDVNRLGALSTSSSASQRKEFKFPPIKAEVREMSMKSEFERRSNVQAMKLSSHEITTIAGRPSASTNSEEVKAAVPSSNATGNICKPAAGPAPPPPPPPLGHPLPKAPHAPLAPAPAPPVPPPPKMPTAASSSNPPPPGPPTPPAPRPAAGPGPPPPPSRAGPGPGPPPPPSRGGAGPPPPAMPGGPKARGPPPLKKAGNVAGPPVADNKTKLKPFFWDKVTANPDQAMVWDQIKAGSFQ